MKLIYTLPVLIIFLTSLTGCYTIPQHYAEDEEEYYDVYYIPIPNDPCPLLEPNPDPQPIIITPAPTIDRKGFEEQTRDPLRGNNDRGNDERKPEPISNPVKKDRGRS